MIRSSVQVRLSASHPVSLASISRARGSCRYKGLGRSALSSLSALVALLCLMTQGEARPPFRVAIDPGHGGRNIGSIDPWHEGKTEKDHTLIIAKKVRRYLQASGVKVWMTRDQDKPLTLQERMRAASAKGVDLYVSVHINDSSVVGPRGHGTFFLARAPFKESRLRLREFNDQTRGRVLKNNIEPSDDADLSRADLKRLSPLLLDLIHEGAHQESLHLAHVVHNTLDLFTPFGSRGVKQADFGVIKGTSMPAIVCEVGFINHKREGPFVTSPQGREQIARGIALGVLRYLGLRYQVTLTPPSELTPPSTEERDKWLRADLRPSSRRARKGRRARSRARKVRRARKKKRAK